MHTVLHAWKVEKAIIKTRVSTEGQEDKLQEDDCIAFCKEKGLDVMEIISEKASAFKRGKARPEWERCIELAKTNKWHIVLWRYDRAFRNREEFYKFMKVMFEVYGVKIYSVKEPSILSLWDLMDKQNIEDPVQSELIRGILKVLWNFLIQNAGEEAEQESLKKSQRVRLSVVKDGRVTKSYKGNKWGRKPLDQKIISAILEASSSGKSITEICKTITYWDSNNREKNVSRGVVHKILKSNLQKSKPS